MSALSIPDCEDIRQFLKMNNPKSDRSHIFYPAFLAKQTILNSGRCQV
jgi:hypothetical protein